MHYDAKLQAFLDFVLSQYVQEGVDELDQARACSQLRTWRIEGRPGFLRLWPE
jgi:hypothetical protein